MTQSIVYEQSQVSFLCCLSPKPTLPKTNPNHNIDPQKDREKDKKISLRKYQQSHMKQTQYRLSIKESFTAGTYLKTTRLSDISETHKMATPTKNHLATGQRLSMQGQSLNLRADTRSSFEKSTPNYEELHSFHTPYKTEGKILSKTTKIQRIQPVATEELKRTVKGIPFHRIVKLSSLKESVCSINQSGSQRQRFQQSQIIMDFFNPSAARLNAIETLIKHRQVQSIPNLLADRQ